MGKFLRGPCFRMSSKISLFFPPTKKFSKLKIVPFVQENKFHTQILRKIHIRLIWRFLFLSDVVWYPFCTSGNISGQCNGLDVHLLFLRQSNYHTFRSNRRWNHSNLLVHLSYEATTTHAIHHCTQSKRSLSNRI